LIKELTETVTVNFDTFAAASVGAVVSVIGFALFALVINLLSPILTQVYEEWTWYIAPIIGSTVGAAINGWHAINAINVILIIALGAFIGWVVMVIRGAVIDKEIINLKSVIDLAIPGIGFGTVNGAILGGIFKVLDVTLGIDWMLAG